MADKVVYPGKDLEAMSFAANYHRWILDEFKPFLGKHIVEVGAGSGSFSEMLLETKPETFTGIEPSEMYDALAANVGGNNGTEVRLHHAIFAQVATSLAGKPDSIIYVNVLEHIEDDLGELKLICDTLVPGGKVLIFVPALASLMSDFDRSIGHFRRYGKKELEDKVRAAGFSIKTSKFFDLPGVIPWYINYRLLGSKKLGGGAVSLYDNAVVPLTRKWESVFGAPFGKNILLVGEKDA